MRIPIIIPDFSAMAEPLRLGEWAVDIGDEVIAGESLTELICPGLVIELASPTSGVIAELTRQAEQSVTPGDIVGWIESETTGVADAGL
jgi:pyruvate/2-oxoglutarate dehydrogenase complex dihydrolipoamide acyltransferase (E2) component